MLIWVGERGNRTGRDEKKIRLNQAYGRFYCKLITSGPQTPLEELGDIGLL